MNESILLPIGIAAILFWIYCITQYPKAITKILSFKNADKTIDFFLSVFIWFLTISSVTTLIYLVNKYL